MVRVFALAAALALVAPQARADAPGLEARIGQMIMIGFRGDAPDDAWVATVTRQIADGKIGGVMHLGYNIRYRATTAAINRSFHAASPNLPPLIAVDQEGGRVARLTPAQGFAATPSAREVAATMDESAAGETYGRMAAGLAGWGFNVNFGPVADVDVNPDNPIIGALGRSFSADPETVADYASAFVLAHRVHGVLTSPKHLPGHGSSAVDSHLALPDVTESWSRAELVPFRELIACGLADMVMVGHLYNARLQGDSPEPSSLSPAIVRDLLRGELGFGGVAITDDLQMEAIAATHTLEQTVLKAVAAGNDILLFANYREPDIDLPEKVIAILSAAAAADPAVAEAIAASHVRIAALKARLARAEEPAR